MNSGGNNATAMATPNTTGVYRGANFDRAERCPRRTTTLRSLYRVNDPGQSGVVGQGGDAVLERAGFVDRASEHRITGGFFAGRLTPVIGAWLTAERPSSTSPSRAMRSPGLTRTRAPMVICFGARLAPCAVSLLLYRGLFRGQVKQATDSVTSAIQRFGFDYLGQREQYHHHCRFGPVADQHGTRDRNRHEGVHIKITVLRAQSTPSCRWRGHP